MNPETLLRLVAFELKTAGDSNDLQDVQFKIESRCRLIGIAEMSIAEADNAKFELREISRKKYAAKGGAL